MTITENDQRLLCSQLARKDRDYPSFAMRILPWPVNIGVTQRGVFHAVHHVVVIEIILSGEFGYAVWGEWSLGRILGSRPLFGLAVNYTARRNEQDALRAKFARAFQHVEQTIHVRLRIKPGIFYRGAHVHLRGVMVDDIEAADFFEQLAHGLVINGR